jgi:hypothetical protein
LSKAEWDDGQEEQRQAGERFHRVIEDPDPQNTKRRERIMKLTTKTKKEIEVLTLAGS